MSGVGRPKEARGKANQPIELLERPSSLKPFLRSVDVMMSEVDSRRGGHDKLADPATDLAATGDADAQLEWGKDRS